MQSVLDEEVALRTSGPVGRTRRLPQRVREAAATVFDLGHDRGLEARFESAVLALRGLLGKGAPLSASSIARLREKWIVEYNAWRHRRLDADNGSPMKGATMLATLKRLGVIASFSRPQVSNDNPFSEALFRTLKYRPEYPSTPC